MAPSIWHSLKTPILGLSPMDGITDAAFRAVVEDIGHPTVMYTEFVSSEGLSRGITRLLVPFVRKPGYTPLIGQLFGANPERMYVATLILCHTGMDGIDINMGCPDKHVTNSGGGAALIGNVPKATELFLAVRTAISDYQNGKTLAEYAFSQKFVSGILNIQNIGDKNRKIGVSIKTRIGKNTIQIHDWIEPLCALQPDCLSVHGRTAAQLYKGSADWDTLHETSIIAKNYHVLCLGNGDIDSYDQALSRTKQFTPDGVLIGRGALGNPWVFTGVTPTFSDRIDAALLHLTYFEQLIPNANPLSLRKHLAWYIKGSDNATEIRSHIMTLTDIPSYREYLSGLLDM